ncbi:MAG: zinc ribbon domain-containing protein [Chloroflexi bacterium]|nr:zinc ribbon domain-containing protein [Chloroflexota bacterium]
MTSNKSETRVTPPLLLGLAKCRECGALMTILGTDGAGWRRYACTRSTEFFDIPCDTPEVDTRRLDALVLENLVANVITDDLLSDVIHQVQQDAASGDSPILDHGNTKPAPDAEQRKTVHWETPGGSPVTNEGRHTQQVRVQPTEPAPDFRQYVADETRVESYARSADTYLREINTTATRRLLELLVEEVPVAAGYAIVNYRMPLPIGSRDEHAHGVIAL